VELNEKEIIYDWNSVEKVAPLSQEPLQFYDETLRDGIQCPSATDPSIEDKLALLHMMDDMGIHWADIGLPGAGPRAVADVTRIAREIVDQKLDIKPSCAARTHVADVQAVVDIAQDVGEPIEVMAFIGASPIRHYAEGWDLDRMLGFIESSISLAVENDLPATFVTEDTIRSRPEILAALFKCAIDNGARRLCLCDTVGHATPDGVENLINFTKGFIRASGVDVAIDWHGHNDRGLALTNAIRAAEYGATRIHGTALGIGERVGNTAMDQLLINLKLLGEIDNDLSRLREYAELSADALGMPIPRNYPVFGEDAFKTATGVHAAAIIKAKKKGDDWLADRIYSGVPASWVGKVQEIEVGPMSGESNVVYWLRKRGIEPGTELVGRIFEAAKSANQTLTEAEIQRRHSSHDLRTVSTTPHRPSRSSRFVADARDSHTRTIHAMRERAHDADHARRRGPRSRRRQRCTVARATPDGPPEASTPRARARAQPHRQCGSQGRHRRRHRIARPGADRSRARQSEGQSEQPRQRAGSRRRARRRDGRRRRAADRAHDRALSPAPGRSTDRTRDPLRGR